MTRLELHPVTLREARAFVLAFHRHHPPPQGGLFAIGLAMGDDVVGVAIVGKPVSRMLGRLPYVAEVTRLAVIEGHRNGCSMLYAAAGFRVVAVVEGRSWDRPGRPRVDTHPTQGKLRLEIA